MDKKDIAEKIFDRLNEKKALRQSLPMHLDADKFKFMVCDDIIQALESCEKPYCEDCHGTGETGIYSLGRGWRNVPCESCMQPTVNDAKGE